MLANVRRSLYFFNRYIFSVSGRSGPLADQNAANKKKGTGEGGYGVGVVRGGRKKEKTDADELLKGTFGRGRPWSGVFIKILSIF